MEDECTTVTQEGNTSAAAATATAARYPSRRLSSLCSHFSLSRSSWSTTQRYDTTETRCRNNAQLQTRNDQRQ
ncbi:Uncharacterized protein DBV15_04954 [Temnothorax longispinosus]|uniref:Uncharacterized protein n=1 Tax=Temnothorax longispinosus TaxID=300112 RepID=A0A4S2KUR0_9HYME|nr:Uncharacterized protein DBV15_04954 [Temnothorax longispinosus]